MQKKDILKRMEQLIDQITYHDNLYFNLDAPEISDADYDAMYQELVALEKQYPQWILKHSPTQRAAGYAAGHFTTLEHGKPMLSLDKALNHEQFLEFDVRLHKLLSLRAEQPITYFCECKLDGLSINLTYHEGKLTTAATRGDGMMGEDVTHNVLTIEHLPKHIARAPRILELRGEILMQKKDFLLLNQEQISKQAKPFANPRNAAAGSLRQLDATIAQQRFLHCVMYGYGYVDDKDWCGSYTKLQEQLKAWGFARSPYVKTCYGVEEVMAFFEKVQKKRSSLAFEIDGVVVKADAFAHHEQAGSVAKYPRGMIALKFPSSEAITRLDGLQFQVGRTGVITPVAQLRPVTLHQVTIQKATLHNIEYLKKLGLQLNDHVVVQRAGDVIPQVLRVFERTQESLPITLPTYCPCCHTRLVASDTLIALRCPGQDCFDQKLGRWEHFVSKAAMNIKGCASSILKKLLEARYIHHFADIFLLTPEQLRTLERFSHRSAQNLYQAIQAARTTHPYRVLYALGIEHVGVETSKALLLHFKSLENVSIAAAATASIDALLAVDQIGPQIAQAIQRYFSEPVNIANLQALLKLVKFEPMVQTPLGGEHPWAHKRFVITGSFKGFSRDVIARWIESLGGKIVTSISRKTDYLVVGDDPGSKLSKAQAWNIAILHASDIIPLLAKYEENR